MRMRLGVFNSDVPLKAVQRFQGGKDELKTFLPPARHGFDPIHGLGGKNEGNPDKKARAFRLSLFNAKHKCFLVRCHKIVKLFVAS